jgi:hypothetical protein
MCNPNRICNNKYDRLCVICVICSTRCIRFKVNKIQNCNVCTYALWYNSYTNIFVAQFQLIYNKLKWQSQLCVLFMYEERSESKERFANQRYLWIIGMKQNMQVLSHTFTYFSIGHWTLRHLSYRDTNLLIPSSYQKAAVPTCTNFAVLQMFGDNFVYNCTRQIRALFVHFANCEMSILSNDAVGSPFASMRLWWQRVALISQHHEHLFAHP